MHIPFMQSKIQLKRLCFQMNLIGLFPVCFDFQMVADKWGLCVHMQSEKTNVITLQATCKANVQLTFSLLIVGCQVTKRGAC